MIRHHRPARLAAGLMLSLLALTGCHQAMPVASAQEASAPAAAASGRAKAMDAWQDEIIYFVLTDRFSNGNRANDFNVKPNDLNAYHGGDLDGLIKKLDYIKDMGATAIWLTPINDNKDEDLVGKYWGFHGYWTKDINKVDEHLGDEAKFKQLVKEAHARGLKVVLDIVVNHMGYDAPMVQDPKFGDWFHHNGNVKNWDDQWQLENCDLSGLPDFNTENPKVLDFMVDTWAGWANRTAVDGFRVDTVKHVPIAFWGKFTRSLKAKVKNDFLLLGEVLHGDPGYVAPYSKEGGFDTTFDFPMYFTMTDVFARGQSMRKLGDRLRGDGNYRDANLLSPFLDNHDVPRFTSIANGDERKLRLGLDFLFTMRGVPTMYYGTENAMQGAQEPENRQDMQFGANPKLNAHVKTLMHLRQELAPLRRGAMLEMWQDDDVYAYSRLAGKDEVIVALNNDGGAKSRDIPLRAESSLPDGTVLVNKLGSDTVTVEHHKIHVNFAGKEGKIYVVAAKKAPQRARD